MIDVIDIIVDIRNIQASFKRMMPLIEDEVDIISLDESRCYVSSQSPLLVSPFR